MARKACADQIYRHIIWNLLGVLFYYHGDNMGIHFLYTLGERKNWQSLASIWEG
jgi:hypothetical protein